MIPMLVMTHPRQSSAPAPSPTWTPRQVEILDRARELVEERGLANLTLKQVAERVGFSEAAIYRHFASKKALVFALVDRLRGMLLGPILTIAEDRELPPHERLERMVGHHVALLRKTRGLPILLLAEGIASGDRELLERMTGVLAGYLGILAAVLGEIGVPAAPPLPHQALLFIGLPAVLGLQARAFPEQALGAAETAALLAHYVRALTAGAVPPQEVVP